MTIYKGKEILDFSDKELLDVQYDLQWLLAHRDNRLRDAKERHKIFNFQTINPAFVKIQTETNDEIAVRKARG